MLHCCKEFITTNIRLTLPRSVKRNRRLTMASNETCYPSTKSNKVKSFIPIQQNKVTKYSTIHLKSSKKKLNNNALHSFVRFLKLKINKTL